MPSTLLLSVIALAAASYTQQPNATVQRDAMKKLEFLGGHWVGDATVSRGPGEPMKLQQSEEVQYKLDGLVMLVEGTGRDADGKVVFQALATISYDDAASAYHIRAYNDGRYLDTELTVTPNGFAWGFANGPLKVSNTMQLNEKGEWTEVTETTYGSTPPRKSVEMRLRKQQHSAAVSR
jgi:hypothetical protein